MEQVLLHEGPSKRVGAARNKVAALLVLLLSGGVVLAAMKGGWLPTPHQLQLGRQPELGVASLKSLRVLRPEQWLLYAFKPDDSGNSPSLVTPGFMLFDYDDEDIELFTRTRMNSLHTDFKVYDSQVKASDGFSASVGINGSFGAFSAAVNTSTTQAFSSVNKIFRADSFVYAEKYIVQLDSIYPEKHLTSAAKDFLLNESPEAIAALGAFYPTQLTLGGMSRSTYIKQAREGESSSSFEVSVQAQADHLLAAASASATESSASAGTSSGADIIHVKVSTEGGDTTIWHEATPQTLHQVQAKWAETVTDENLFPIKFELAPIWTLIHRYNQSKAYEVEAFLRSKWGEQLRALKADDNNPRVQIELTRGASAHWMYNSRWTGADPSFTVYQPQPVWTGAGSATYYPIGDVGKAILGDDDFQASDLPMFSQNIRHPIDSKMIWNSISSGAAGKYHGYFWSLTAPQGYACIGVAVTAGERPDLNKYACLPEHCVQWIETSTITWTGTATWTERIAVFQSPVDPLYITAAGDGNDPSQEIRNSRKMTVGKIRTYCL